MIHRFFKIIACTLLLLSVITVHAQDEDPGIGFEDENGDVDGTVESPIAPIDSQIVFLAVAGTVLAFFRYRLIKNDD